MSPILQVPSYLSQAGITSEMQEGEVTLYEHHQSIPILSNQLYKNRRSTSKQHPLRVYSSPISILLLPSTVICLYPHTHESLDLPPSYGHHPAQLPPYIKSSTTSKISNIKQSKLKTSKPKQACSFNNYNSLYSMQSQPNNPRWDQTSETAKVS